MPEDMVARDGVEPPPAFCALGYTMGAYGAGMSLYSHFIARGKEVVFPKNTAMEIGIGTRKIGAAQQTRTDPATVGTEKD